MDMNIGEDMIQPTAGGQGRPWREKKVEYELRGGVGKPNNSLQ